MVTLQEQDKNALNNYRFIDLFCGIGGFHMALESFGAKCVFASDIDDGAKRLYQKNYNIYPQGDIKNVKAEEIPHHEILCGGFPCQAFSVSGKGKGFSDQKTGKLFFEINRLLKYHHPKIVLLENVANLEKHWHGYSIKHIMSALRARGYKPFKKVLNALDFGIPQYRKRLYIVAFREDLEIEKFVFPEGIKNRASLKKILIDNVGEQYFIQQKFELRDNIDEIEKNAKQPYIRVGEIGLGRQGERIYSIQGCSTTLSASSGGPGGRTGMYYINNRVRKLTPRECARLLGFPDTFQLAETDNQAYQQFGNSVVIDVLQYIILEVIKNLQGAKKDGKTEYSFYDEL